MNVKVLRLQRSAVYTEFLDKFWTKNSINSLLVKLRKFGTGVIFVTFGDAI